MARVSDLPVARRRTKYTPLETGSPRNPARPRRLRFVQKRGLRRPRPSRDAPRRHRSRPPPASSREIEHDRSAGIERVRPISHQTKIARCLGPVGDRRLARPLNDLDALVRRDVPQNVRRTVGPQHFHVPGVLMLVETESQREVVLAQVSITAPNHLPPEKRGARIDRYARPDTVPVVRDAFEFDLQPVVAREVVSVDSIRSVVGGHAEIGVAVRIDVRPSGSQGGSIVVETDQGRDLGEGSALISPEAVRAEVVRKEKVHVAVEVEIGPTGAFASRGVIHSERGRDVHECVTRPFVPVEAVRLVILADVEIEISVVVVVGPRDGPRASRVRHPQ